MQRAPFVAIGAAILMAGACGPAGAQPSSDAPGTQPATALENFRHVQIGNGLLTAQVYPPGENELYRGTRFDHAGVVFHITHKGQDFSTYWFDRFVTDPRDTDFAAATRAEEAAELACFRATETRARLSAFADRKRS